MALRAAGEAEASYSFQGPLDHVLLHALAAKVLEHLGIREASRLRGEKSWGVSLKNNWEKVNLQRKNCFTFRRSHGILAQRLRQGCREASGTDRVPESRFASAKVRRTAWASAPCNVRKGRGGHPPRLVAAGAPQLHCRGLNSVADDAGVRHSLLETELRRRKHLSRRTFAQGVSLSSIN
eukprot:scaffold69_cov248-Pinguiococcus_pyrenoidosus.AAC.74